MVQHDSSRPAAAHSHAHDSTAVLVVRTPPLDRGRYAGVTGAGLVVGRGESSDLVLTDPSVSRRHAMIRRRDGEYAVEDLGSLNGAYLNGNRFTAPQALRDGDELRCGGTAASSGWRWRFDRKGRAGIQPLIPTGTPARRPNRSTRRVRTTPATRCVTICAPLQGFGFRFAICPTRLGRGHYPAACSGKRRVRRRPLVAACWCSGRARDQHNLHHETGRREGPRTCGDHRSGEQRSAIYHRQRDVTYRVRPPDARPAECGTGQQHLPSAEAVKPNVGRRTGEFRRGDRRWRGRDRRDPGDAEGAGMRSDAGGRGRRVRVRCDQEHVKPARVYSGGTTRGTLTRKTSPLWPSVVRPISTPLSSAISTSLSRLPIWASGRPCWWSSTPLRTSLLWSPCGDSRAARRSRHSPVSRRDHAAPKAFECAPGDELVGIFMVDDACPWSSRRSSSMSYQESKLRNRIGRHRL